MTHRHNGQALVLGLLVTGVGLIAMVGLFNLGQLALARSKLTHATDAAAYSGAIVQARTVNLIAHVQRAQVAHQVAIAHLVTLGAWASFGHTQAQQLVRGNPPVVAIGIIFGPSHALAYARARAIVSNHRTSLKQALKGHDDIVHGVLAQANRRLVRDLPRLRAAAIEQVLTENLPGLRVGAATGSRSADVHYSIAQDNWRSSVQLEQKAGGSGMPGLVATAAQRYGFLGPRVFDASNLWPVSYRCPLLRHNLRRRGSTWLDSKGQWRAVDTQSFHKLRSNKWIGCYYREYAMGWGVARVKPAALGTHSKAAPDDFSQEAFWKWVQRRTDWDLKSKRDNPMSNSYGMRQAWHPALKGLPSSIAWRLNDSGSASFALQVTQTGRAIGTFDGRTRMRASSGNFGFNGIGIDGALSSQSAAETYFLRPNDPSRNKRRWARVPTAASQITTFRPYWRARLIDAPTHRKGQK